MPADSRDMVLVPRTWLESFDREANPNEAIADNGGSVWDFFCHEAEQFLSASPARGERDAPSRWSAVRNLFVRHAEAFNKATRYEEASAIADKAGREIEELFAPSTTSTAEQVDAPRDEQGRDAYQIIADCNREAMMRRSGVKDRSRDPLFGPPNDMAVSRVLLAERPDIDPEEADRLAVKINDALSALIAPSPGEGDAPVAWLCKACHAPRTVAPCHKCGGPLTKPADGWEWPALPDVDRIRALAREVGYGLGVHGSLERDLDLIAAPWVADAVSPAELAAHIAAGLPGQVVATFDDAPHGRAGFNIKQDGWFKMIDLSVMRPTPATPEGAENDADTLAVLPDNVVIAQSLSRELRERAHDEARSYLYDRRQRLAALQPQAAWKPNRPD